MTVLVTGAGLIGAHTARLLLDQGAGVVLYDPFPSPRYIESVVGPGRKLLYVERGDARDFATIVEVMRRRGVTRILHTAGLLSARVDENPYLAFQTNVLGTLNAIEASRLHGLARIVVISSAQVYQWEEAEPGPGPVAEELPYRLPTTLYATSKAMIELLVRAYQRLPGVNALICRPAAVYGRGEFVGGARSGQAVQDLLVRALTEPLGAEIPVDLPAAERIYVKDVAAAIKDLGFLEKPTARVYNLGSGEIVGPRELAAAINEAIPAARARPAGDSSPTRPLLDLTRARTDLGYVPQWPLRRAIPDYVAELRQALAASLRST